MDSFEWEGDAWRNQRRRAARRPSERGRWSFVGLTIAIMAVSAWVVVPLGPIPFTAADVRHHVCHSGAESQGGHCGHHGLLAAGCGGGARVLGHARWNQCSGRADGRLSVGIPLRRGRLPRCFCTRCARGSVAGGKNAPRLTAREKLAMRRRSSARVRSAQLRGRDYRRHHLYGYRFVCGCVQYMVVGHVDLLRRSSRRWRRCMVVDLCKIVAAVICADAVRRRAVGVSSLRNPRANTRGPRNGRPRVAITGPNRHLLTSPLNGHRSYAITGPELAFTLRKRS